MNTFEEAFEAGIIRYLMIHASNPNPDCREDANLCPL